MVIPIQEGREITLSYDANIEENENEIEVPKNEKKMLIEEEKEFTISSFIPQREGYEFLGWSNDKGNNQVDYEPGNVIKLNGDKTLYAVWEEINGSVSGFYNIKHEYYLKDKNGNMILEGRYDLDTDIIWFEYREKIIVGVSSEEEKVDIEVKKKPNYNMDNIMYTYAYFENSGNILIERDKTKEITLKYVREEENETKIKVEKIWEDENNKYGKRPENVVLQIKNGEEVVAEMEVSEENNWSYEFVVPKYDSDGNEIEYAVDEKETDVNYEKIIDGYKVINKYKVEEEKNENEENTENNDIIKNEENVDTSDINIWMYVSIAIVSIVVIVLVIILVKKNDKKSK